MFSSCSTIGISSKATKGWVSGNEFESVKKLSIGTINVDKAGGGWSIEREISEVLPLIFLEQGYVFLKPEEEVDYIVDVYAAERDYYVGWNTEKSITTEVSFRLPEEKTPIKVETPFAAGRTVAQGTLGLSSSKNVESLLRSSAKKLIKYINKFNKAKKKQERRENEKAKNTN
jgi:hypothetical protein